MEVAARNTGREWIQGLAVFRTAKRSIQETKSARGMTLRERIRKIISTANGDIVVLSDDISAKMMSPVLDALNGKANALGHDSFDYERESDEYPEVLYKALWIYIRPVVFDLLEKEHPNHESRSRYMTSEQRLRENGGAA